MPSSQTLRAYQVHNKTWRSWCDRYGVVSFPPDPGMLVRYLRERQADGVSFSSLMGCWAALKWEAQRQGAAFVDDDYLAAVQLIRHSSAHYAPNGKMALTRDQVYDMATEGTRDLRSPFRERNLAVILTGYQFALRRSELAALSTTDLEWEQGRVIAVRGMTARFMGRTIKDDVAWALEQWHRFLPDAGPLYRPISTNGRPIKRHMSAWAMADITKKAAEAIGIDPILIGSESLVKAERLTPLGTTVQEWQRSLAS